MAGRRWVSTLRRYVRRLALIEAVIVAVTGAVSWLVGWRDSEKVSFVLLVVGAIIFCIGPFSMLGGMRTRGNFFYQYGQTVTYTRMDERIAADKAELQRSTDLLIPSVIIGSLTMVIAGLLPTLLG